MKKRLALVTIALFGVTTSAYGVVEFELFAGSRASSFGVDKSSVTTEEDSDSTASESSSSEETKKASSKYSGAEFGFAAYVQPVPLVPVAIGLSAMQQNFKGNEGDMNETISGLSSAVVLTAWGPLGQFQPFVKASYDIYSDHKYTAQYDESRILSMDPDEKVPTKIQLDGKMTGYHGAVGIRYRAVPTLGFFLQADYGSEKFESNRISVMQENWGLVAESEDLPKFKLESLSMLLGVNVGI